MTTPQDRLKLIEEQLARINAQTHQLTTTTPSEQQAPAQVPQESLSDYAWSFCQGFVQGFSLLFQGALPGGYKKHQIPDSRNDRRNKPKDKLRKPKPVYSAEVYPGDVPRRESEEPEDAIIVTLRENKALPAAHQKQLPKPVYRLPGGKRPSK